MNDAFQSRMVELDAVVEQCRGEGAFATGIVRDTSNRFQRDWQWWSVQIERTQADGSEKRRAMAEVTLNEPAPGVPSVFKARWLVRIWQGVGTDSFRQEGGWPLAWDAPSPKDLDETMVALFHEANMVIARALNGRA